VIDRREHAVIQQEAVNRSFGIGVAAHDLAAVVDANRPCFCRAIWMIDGGEDTPIQKKTVADERGGVAGAGAAHHHAHHVG
jgi:hypothetical protein